jgi:hypothetical protein
LNNTGVAWAAVANTALKITASSNILFFISPPSYMPFTRTACPSFHFTIHF